MNRHTTITGAAGIALAATLTACQAQPGHSGSDAANAAPTPTKTAAPACTLDYGTDHTGIHAHGGKIDAAVALDCNGTATDILVSLTLAYAPTGTPMSRDQEADGAEYENARSAYTATAACKPGSYALHVLYSADVTGSILTDHAWGKTATVTAADCAEGN